MICYDREFPESARILMLKGAEMILTPNACKLDDDRLGQFRARAYENMVGVAMANYAKPDPADDHSHLAPLDVCNGHSVAFSGIKFDREGNALDHKLVEAGEGEELPIATFDLDALRAYRAYETGGDAYRKPALYQALSDDTPLPVFARADSRRAPLPRAQLPSATALSPSSSADSGGGIRTRDLRVMSPTSYLAAPPRVATNKNSTGLPAFKTAHGACGGARALRGAKPSQSLLK